MNIQAAKSGSHRAPWYALVVLTVVIVTYGLVPVSDASKRLDEIPQKDFSYTSEEIDLTPEEASFLGEAAAVKRLYHLSDGSSLMLIAVDGTKDRHVVHNPAFCLVGAGQEITSEQPIPLPNGRGAVIKIEMEQGFQEMAYWYTNGENRYTSFAKLLWHSILNRLSLGRLDQAPVMVVIYSPSNKKINWNRIPDQLPFLMDI